ncbi:MAG TPA: glycosyltransferase family 2 protein [Niabella sp.]|jgi:glycosyltransferase involved in cell wall biosynthesis|nr:glycosyltransferase family 2 protein [Niabella sp.]HRP58964.1 glycosyltransferase family 2 protein [Vicingus sp.]
MKKLKISIITPSYNQGEFIEDTILSVIGQGYDNYEYIIIDGGSKDDTVEIIKKYESKIYYWVSEKDKGQTDAINKGMKKATGDIVCWINSDDVLLPNALNIVANYFNRNADLEFLNGLSIEIDRKGYVKKLTHIFQNKWFARNGCFNVCQQGMFWKKSVFNKVGYLDETFHGCMDWEFIVRLYENDVKMAQFNKPLGAIRIYGETKTAMGGKIWLNDWKKIANRYSGQYIHKRKSIFFILYAFIKLFKGYYISDIIFKVKHKNRKFNSITIE